MQNLINIKIGVLSAYNQLSLYQVNSELSKNNQVNNVDKLKGKHHSHLIKVFLEI